MPYFFIVLALVDCSRTVVRVLEAKASALLQGLYSGSVVHQLMEGTDKKAGGEIQIPDGLRPLLEIFAKETLRSRPDDILLFAKVFFEELYQQKSCHGCDVLSNPELYEKFRVHLYMKCGQMCRSPPRNTMDLAATKIQAAFRGHIVRARPDKFGTAPLQSQNRRNSSELLGERNFEDITKRRSSNNECGRVDPNEERAATKIQAEFRGYITRKHLEQIKKEIGTNDNSVH